ncbi:MAG: hypothetical protein GKR87_14845 [Kiritimatiellae bacterium]|nr:hypothetical protein [Kiritimatiellia bacterium]
MISTQAKPMFLYLNGEPSELRPVAMETTVRLNNSTMNIFAEQERLFI